MLFSSSAAALSAALLTAAVSSAEPTASLLVQAYVSTAGPYGEGWKLNLKPDGKVSLEIWYMLNPMGKMSGEFLVSSEDVQDLRNTIETERFLELPSSISPATAPLHAPDLRLSITLEDKVHEVRVYDPDQFKEDERVRRFLSVWRRAFAMVPLRPGW
jgi:hypothetical protein